MSSLCSDFFCSYMPGEQACSTCPIPSSCPNHSSKAFSVLDFETIINEAGGMYTQEDLQRLNILFFRWQESVRRYSNQPKKRTFVLKHSSKAFSVLDFETIINEAGGMYTQEDLQRLNILFFRWQESVRRYSNQPKKRTFVLKYRIVSRYSILTKALQAARCC